jgi:hypothetical protein
LAGLFLRRDDFKESTKRHLGGRVNFRCSNPTCRKFTQEPNSSDTENYINLGEAAHIKAASPGGARYDPKMTRKERRSAENGIWLCKECAYIIDHDQDNFSVETLLTWKRTAEQKAKRDSSLKEDEIPKIINGLDIEIEELDSFSNEYDLNNPACSYCAYDSSGNAYGTNVIDYNEYYRQINIYNSMMWSKYDKNVLPFIQTALVKCQCVLGESDKNVIDAFNEFKLLNTEKRYFRDMLLILIKLKTIMSWR